MLLISGTGRCGTGYVAELLRACGVRCSHEEVYSTRAALSGKADWDGWEAEASWMAVPFFATEAAYKVLLVRDPLDVVKSYVDLGFFDRGHDWYVVMASRCPEAFAEGSYAERALAFWCRWNRAAELWADEIVQVEQVGVATVAGWLRRLGIHADAELVGILARAVRDVPRDVNAKSSEKVGDWPKAWPVFRPALARAAQRQAESYGYML